MKTSTAALFTLLVGLAFLLLVERRSTSPASPSRSETVSGQSAVSDKDLDALLAARNWDGLRKALSQKQDDESLAWLHDKVNSGAGFFVSFLYHQELWASGMRQQVSDPGKDLKLSAAMMFLYTIELITIDGAVCADISARGHRGDQMFMKGAPAIKYMKTLPVDLKTTIVDDAIALEKKTAPLRGVDDLICRGGMAQPTLLPPETYRPMQEEERKNLRPALLKIVQ